MRKATVLVIQGIDQGARFDLDGSELGIGRGVQNGIRLHDSEASRTHARLQLVDGQYLLTDLNSSNGSFVNGKSVRMRELRPGDQIQIGRTVMLFTSDESQADDSVLAGERVSFLPQHDPADRSAIVGAASAREALEPLEGDLRSGAVSQTLANLQVLYRISEEVVRPSLSIDQLLSRILELAIEVSGADRGCILVRGAQTGQLTPAVLRHRRGEDAAGRMPVSRSIVEYVLSKGQGVRTSDAQADARFTPGQSIFQAGIREAICVPIQGRYDILGVLYADITTPPERVILEGGPGNRFNEELLRLMVAIGRQAALAVEDNRYQQALVKAERLAAVGQTIAILSHHIKNILQGVRGGSYLIEKGLGDENTDLVRKGWGIVERNQTKIYNLVMDMLTFSKERRPALVEGDVNACVYEVCELMQARATELGVMLEWRGAPDMPQTTFDPEGIHRAVLNIVTNALDAVEEVEAGKVVVETGHDAQTRMVWVMVRDNGPGISAEQRGKLFNLFESTKGARGTGIGLAVSQKILREHGGEITVTSEPGAGAKFLLEWPLMEDEGSRVEGATVV